MLLKCSIGDIDFFDFSHIRKTLMIYCEDALDESDHYYRYNDCTQ